MGVLINESKKKYQLPKSGPTQAVCFNVWDLGFQKGSWKGEEKITPQVAVGFELQERYSEGINSGKRLLMSRIFTKSLGQKSNLKAFMESWLGRNLSPQEIKSFDLELMIGENALLNIIHVEKDDGTVNARIKSISPILQGLPALTAEGLRYTPEWIKKMIAGQVQPEELEEAPF